MERSAWAFNRLGQKLRDTLAIRHGALLVDIGIARTAPKDISESRWLILGRHLAHQKCYTGPGKLPNVRMPVAKKWRHEIECLLEIAHEFLPQVLVEKAKAVKGGL